MNFATTTASHGADRGIADLVDRLGTSAPTLLSVWAHPDDETYLGGGLTAEVAHRGGRVVNVTATLGEHGTDNPLHDPPASLAKRRGSELITALTVLGASASTVLGYEDGTCATIDDRIGARRIASIVEEVRPDAVVSFGPDGVTGHPDHRAVARWTDQALAGRDDAIPLLTTAAGAAWPPELLERMHQVGAFWPDYPERTIDDPCWMIELHGDRLDQKMAALACHKSQIGSLQAALGPDDYRRLASSEAYRAANPSAVQLLAGIDRRHAA